MDVRRFQSLLAAGMRWEAREQQMRLSASAYPHLKPAAQKQMAAELMRSVRAMRTETREDDARNNGLLEGFRAMTKRHQSRWKMPKELLIPASFEKEEG